MAYKEYDIKNKDGSLTHTTVYEGPGVYIKKTVTTYEDEKEEDDSLEDLLDRITIKKVDKGCKGCKGNCKNENHNIAEDIIRRDALNNMHKCKDEVLEMMREKYSIDEIEGLLTALPDLMGDPKVVAGLTDYFMEAYKAKE